MNARKYLKLPHICDLTSYGNNIVATVDEKYINTVSEYINTYAAEHCFETPNMHMLNNGFQKDGYRVCFMAEYFLPDIDKLVTLPFKYETKVLFADDFKNLYKPEWSNALCEERKELDVLGVGVLVEYRKKVIDIALKYGYESLTAFNRAFKKIHGVAPSKIGKKKLLKLLGFQHHLRRNLKKTIKWYQECGKKQELGTRIVKDWLPTSGYEYANAPDIEVYLNPNPKKSVYEVWIPVIKK